LIRVFFMKVYFVGMGVLAREVPRGGGGRLLTPANMGRHSFTRLKISVLGPIFTKFRLAFCTEDLYRIL